MAAAILACLESRFYCGCESLILSGSKLQATNMYDYTKRFSRQVLNDLLVNQPRETATVFANGSSIRILTASQNSIRGPHVPRLYEDEIDVMDAEIAEAATGMISGRGEIPGRQVGLSTLHRPGGTMDKLVTAAPENGFAVHKWNIWESRFYCGCESLILSGSKLQATNMYDYTKRFSRQVLNDLLVNQPRETATVFANGSSIRILTASQNSIRGPHVPRLYEDEIDVMDAEIAEAATGMISGRGEIPGRQVGLSTLHRPGGTMDRLVTAAPENGFNVHKWNIWESIERCGTDRSCSRCCLWEACRGKARDGEGLVKIDDAIRQYRNWSKNRWEAEALCERPSVEGLVFPEFDPRMNGLHVSDKVGHQADLPVYRAIDWGWNYFAGLHVQLLAGQTVRVIGEYKGQNLRLRDNMEAMLKLEKQRGYKIAATYVDPAGAGRNDQTGMGNVELLRNEYGIDCTYTTASRLRAVQTGLELIRDWLAPAAGQSRLTISGQCKWLIESFCNYRNQRTASGAYIDRPEENTPWEHPLDALRYFFVNELAAAETAGVGKLTAW